MSFLLPYLEGGRETWESEGRRKDGERMPIEGSTRRIEGRSGNFYTYVLRDLTERKRFEARLLYLADHDPLTGLFNRRRFWEELERQLMQTRRYGTHGALLFLDLDAFKAVNDTLGHGAGDELLLSVAGLLRVQVRETGVLARLVGDEFALLLPQTLADEAQVVAGRTREAMLHHAVVVGGRPVGVTASIGISLFPEHGITADELMVRADTALYRAKEYEGNRVCLYAPDQAGPGPVESRFDLEKRLRGALEKDNLLLYAQPILDLRRNQVTRYELLLRMAGDGGEVVPPASTCPWIT